MTVIKQVMDRTLRLTSTPRRYRVVRDYLAIAGSEIALRPIQFVKEFIVTKYLGPADYGILKSIELIKMLNKYGSFGFKAAAAREIGDARGRDDAQRATDVRNTAYSSEIILAGVLFIAGMGFSLFFESRKISLLIMLASVGMLVTKLSALLAIEATIQKRFVLIGKVGFVSGLVASVTVIPTVPFWGIYAVVTAHALVGLLALVLYTNKLRFHYRFGIDFAQFKRIFRISFPFMMMTASQGSYKYAERLLVIALLGKVALGFYGFALMIVTQFVMFFKAAIKVRTQDIYEALGRAEFDRVHRMVVRETALLFGSSVILIPIAWFLVEPFILAWLPKWTEGIGATQLNLLVLPIQVLPLYTIPVLQSALLDKQKVLPVFQFTGALLLVGGAWILNLSNRLTLEGFIVLNILMNGFLSCSFIAIYYLSFYKAYVMSREPLDV